MSKTELPRASTLSWVCSPAAHAEPGLLLEEGQPTKEDGKSPSHLGQLIFSCLEAPEGFTGQGTEVQLLLRESCWVLHKPNSFRGGIRVTQGFI